MSAILPTQTNQYTCYYTNISFHRYCLIVCLTVALVFISECIVVMRGHTGYKVRLPGYHSTKYHGQIGPRKVGPRTVVPRGPTFRPEKVANLAPGSWSPGLNCSGLSCQGHNCLAGARLSGAQFA